MAKRRSRLQFSLLSLLLLALLCGAGMTLRLHWEPWYLECTLSPERFVQAWENDLIGASFSPDGSRIVATQGDRTVNIWDIGTRTTTLIAMDEKVSPDWMKPALMTPDQQYIITYGKTERQDAMGMITQVWNSRTGKSAGRLAYTESDEVLNFPAQRDGNFYLEKRRVGFPQTELLKISADSSKAVTLDNDMHARVWSLPDGALSGEWKPEPPEPETPIPGFEMFLPESRERPLTAFFINDQAVVLSEYSGKERILKLRAIQGASEVDIPMPDKMNRYQFAVAPDGSRLLGWSQDPATLYLWDTSSGKLLISSKRANKLLVCDHAVFLGGGRVMASLHEDIRGAAGRELWLWNPEANSSIAVALNGWSARDEAFASPDGRRIVTRQDSTQADDQLDHMKMWDATNGLPLFDFVTPGQIGINLDSEQPRPTAVEFSPDGTRFLTYSGHSPSVQVWRRRRPEYAWGIVVLPEFWATVVLVVAFVWNVWRGWRGRRASSNESVPSK